MEPVVDGGWRDSKRSRRCRLRQMMRPQPRVELGCACRFGHSPTVARQEKISNRLR